MCNLPAKKENESAALTIKKPEKFDRMHADTVSKPSPLMSREAQSRDTVLLTCLERRHCPDVAHCPPADTPAPPPGTAQPPILRYSPFNLPWT